MKRSKQQTRYMVTLSMLCGILIVMGMTGIGFIPLPLIKATTMHIPVILGAILLGPTAGSVLGLVFGLCSVWANTVTPSVLSFAFSPFMTNEGIIGMTKSIWIAVGCRVMLGFIAGWLWKLLKKCKLSDILSLPVTAAVASVCHTLMVMGSIYILLAQQYAAAKDVAVSAVFGLIMGTVAGSGIPEAIAAAILVAALGKALLHLLDRLKKV